MELEIFKLPFVKENQILEDFYSILKAFIFEWKIGYMKKSFSWLLKSSRF